MTHDPKAAREAGYNDTISDKPIDGPACQCDECIASYDKGMNVAWLEMVEELEFPE
jgi:hypothetical protein